MTSSQNNKIDKSIQSILRVNHAGEAGAIRIYQAQLQVSKLFHKNLVPFLEETLSHEKEHKKKFLEAMRQKKIIPCYALNLWGVGGYLLGLSTAILGRNSILICTAAIEKTVHQHLKEQINFLEGKDEELKNLIEEIEIEELKHLEFAEKRMHSNFFYNCINKVIKLSTDMLILISTYGEVSKMKKVVN